MDDSGYIMVVLLIGMAVAAVWMSAALPAWRQQVLREKEAELVFRGEQYARAIVLYEQKNNGALPPNIDILVSQHYLRKKYKDPITNDDFVVIGGAQPGQGAQPVNGVPGRGRSAGPGAAGSVQLGGITGVRSKSTNTSIRVYQNQQVYSQWPFDASAMLARMGRAVPQAPGAGRGGPGRGVSDRAGGPGGRAGGPGGRGGRGVGDARGGGRGGNQPPVGRGGLPPIGPGGARGGGS